MTGVSIPGKRSDMTPLNNGRSTDVSLAIFMSFMDNNRI